MQHKYFIFDLCDIRVEFCFAKAMYWSTTKKYANSTNF